MTTTTAPSLTSLEPAHELPSEPRQLYRNQVLGILRLEIRKNILSLRALPMYILALLPVGLLIAMLVVLNITSGDRGNPTMFFGVLFSSYFITAIFLSCLFLFMQLFRGDLMDRSLHYYFLCPVRREILVSSKFLAGLASSVVVLGLSMTCTYGLVMAGLPGTPEASTVVGHYLAYLGVTVLGCAGYGALFMLFGLYFRNPVWPPVALAVWELINPLLPVALKKISIIHYLMSLVPVRTGGQMFEILVKPTPAWLAVPGLLVMIALAAWLSLRRIRMLEITYADD